METEEMKSVNLKAQTHRQAKLLSVEVGRKLNGDLIDDLVMLGIESFRAFGNCRPASAITSNGKQEEKEAKEEAGE